MFRRLAPRMCAAGTQQVAAAAAAAASATSAAAPAAAAAAAASAAVPPPPPPPPQPRKKPRTFEATDEAPAATSAPDASAFPPPPNAYANLGAKNADGEELTPEARRKIEIMKEIGDEAFEENTKVIKNIALRGMRSGLIIVVGVVAFMISLRKKKRRDAAFDAEEEEKKKAAEAAMDPTQRYLQEMGSIGFDVEQGELDAAEAKKKHEAAVAAKK